MTDNCSVPTPTERRIAEIIMRADRTLADAVALSLEAATARAAAELKAMGEEGSTPPLEYFASVIHQRMYCLTCGAGPDTFEGGNPKIAYHVIRNSQNIAKHYWSASIEPYLPQDVELFRSLNLLLKGRMVTRCRTTATAHNS